MDRHLKTMQRDRRAVICNAASCKSALSAFAFAMLCCAAVGPATTQAAPLAGARPNIILIMTDDQGYGDLACHGHPLLHTPHLDRLHAQSTRFRDFQVSPTCAPTRCSIMTGRHEFKSGVTHTILERERMSLAAVTLPQLLKTAGYTAGIFGKWHLGDEPEYQPDQRGFDEVYIHGAGGIGQTYPGSCGDAPDNHYFNPALLHNGKFVETTGYCTDLYFQQAERWIADQAAAGGRFFAYITPNAPHSPHISPGPRYDALYAGRSIDGQSLNDSAVAYYAMISNIDDNVGRLLDKLDTLGIAEQTLVIFMTDNGGTHTRLYSAGMRGSKATPYQGGTRVPSFWHWPGQLAAGVDIDPLAAHIDLLPTLAEIAGAKLPADLQVDGRSLLPLLASSRTPAEPAAAWPDRNIFFHVGRWPRGEADAAKFTQCAIRNARFRFVNNAELYDLQRDPGETTNVADQHPELVASFRAAYDEWWGAARAGMVNEAAVGPDVNPFKALYWQQFGGGPDPALAEQMKWSHAAQFDAPRTRPKK